MQPQNTSVHKPSEYKTDVYTDWCPGCGDYGILSALQMALAELIAAVSNKDDAIAELVIENKPLAPAVLNLPHRHWTTSVTTPISGARQTKTHTNRR